MPRGGESCPVGVWPGGCVAQAPAAPGPTRLPALPAAPARCRWAPAVRGRARNGTRGQAISCPVAVNRAPWPSGRVARWPCGPVALWPGSRVAVWPVAVWPGAPVAAGLRALPVGARRPREGLKWRQGAGDFVPRDGESCPVGVWLGGPVAGWSGGRVAAGAAAPGLRALSVGARRPREGTKWHQGAGDFVPRGGESCPVAVWPGARGGQAVRFRKAIPSACDPWEGCSAWA